MTRLRPLAAAALAAAAASPGHAKVAFTGYGDMRYTAHAPAEIKGPRALLTELKVTETEPTARGAALDSIGIFSTTELSEALRFAVDVTYREIGYKANELRLQYAYLEYDRWEETRFRAGRLTLPFSYFNENRFYPFQRASITAPAFQGAILGLPISDIGASARHSRELGPVIASADLYAVNGYGSVSGSTAVFRSLSVPGGLTIANNLSPRDRNNKIALGGRLSAANSSTAAARIEGGVSYYRGRWDPRGERLLQLAGLHLHGEAAGFDLLAEYLHMSVRGDAGMDRSFGHPDWLTDGYFIDLGYPGGRAFGRSLTPWVRWEDYRSRGEGGGSGRESLRQYSGGFSVRASEAVAVKLELARLEYALPFQNLGDLEIYVDSVAVGVSVTY